ncbi:MAG: methyltransferase domain-containing protein [Candidatus Paceibacterota bacterium]|jgi:predicted SAM-dependent methyltransferase
MTSFKKIPQITLGVLKKIRFYFYKIKTSATLGRVNKINIGSGNTPLPEYCGIDKYYKADLVLDLSKSLLPFKNNSIDAAICISAINYFKRERGEEIIKDVYRVLKRGGVARFGVQDLKAIAKKYTANDTTFFFQKLPNGRDRFKGGETMCDKINCWFYGYGGGKYMYDYETLSILFRKAGFQTVEQKNYRESVLENIDMIDNRPDQMFFLEAIK